MQTLYLTLKRKIACSPCQGLTSEIVVCVDPSITLDSSGFIEGVVLNAELVPDACVPGRWLWRHIISYNEAQLGVGIPPITQEVVEGQFCRSCASKYMDYRASNPKLGNYIMKLPTTAGTAGQILAIDSVVGNLITMEWVTP